MSSINKVILLGYVGRDPETREVNNQKFIVSTFTLAVSEKNQKGEDCAEWFNIVAWNKLAEVVTDHVKKGSRIYLEGKFKTEKYETKEGVEKSTLKIIAEKIVFLDKREQALETRQVQQPSPPAQDAAPVRKYQSYREQPELMAKNNYSNDYARAPYNQEIF